MTCRRGRTHNSNVRNWTLEDGGLDGGGENVIGIEIKVRVGRGDMYKRNGVVRVGNGDGTGEGIGRIGGGVGGLGY